MKSRIKILWLEKKEETQSRSSESFWVFRNLENKKEPTDETGKGQLGKEKKNQE